MIDLELGKCVCAILRIPCACQAFVAQLDKYWLPNIPPPYHLRYAHGKFVTITKYSNITIIGSS